MLTDRVYDQRCHYGFKRKHNEAYDEIKPVNEFVIECHNTRCKEFYCKFSYFTGGEIEDTECPYFVATMRMPIV